MGDEEVDISEKEKKYKEGTGLTYLIVSAHKCINRTCFKAINSLPSII